MDGEIVTLAALAEHSLSNPTIRRGEMMVRVKGYEDVSRDLGHAGIFVTLTCPSRMHARRSASGEANPAYDGTTPRKAQAYATAVKPFGIFHVEKPKKVYRSDRKAWQIHASGRIRTAFRWRLGGRQSPLDSCQ